MVMACVIEGLGHGRQDMGGEDAEGDQAGIGDKRLSCPCQGCIQPDMCMSSPVLPGRSSPKTPLVSVCCLPPVCPPCVGDHV